LKKLNNLSLNNLLLINIRNLGLKSYLLCIIFFLNFLNSLAANAKKISFLEKLQQPDRLDDSDEFKMATEIFPQLHAYNKFFEESVGDKRNSKKLF
jgi:hypothetical protein